MEKQPLVSVVVPTRNSSKYLETVLKSIKNQSYKNIEIIIVDNNSTDNTKENARKYTNKVYNKGPERSSQKNFGTKMARGKYILFLDSDAELTKGVIKECVELVNSGYDIIIIPERHVGFGFWTKAKALERECFLNDDTIETPWFFRKESFLAVGGYDENMFAGEDWDLFERMRKKGFKYTRNNSFIHHHLGYLKFWSMWKKKYYYGKNISLFMSKNNKVVAKKFPLFRKAYFRNWKLLLRHLLLTAGFVTLNVTETLFVSLGIISYRLKRRKK